MTAWRNSLRQRQSTHAPRTRMASWGRALRPGNVSPLWHQTSLELPRPRSSFELVRTPAAVIDEVRVLAAEQTDDQIACTLNSRGYRSGRGRSFTRQRIAYVRSCYGIESYHQQLQRNGWLTLPEIAREIGVHPQTAWTYAKKGLLRAVRANANHLLFEPLSVRSPFARPSKGRRRGSYRATSV